MSSNASSVCAVVVTRNRRERVLECVASLLKQDPTPSVLVVDNASEDASCEALREQFPDVHVARLDANVGGAGGYSYGIDWARRQGFESIWLMDDDAIARKGALSQLLQARDRMFPELRPDIVCSRVLWSDGSVHRMNRPGFRRVARRTQAKIAAMDLVPIRYCTFVSALLSRRAVETHGLPVADYFIWSDDIEYTARILRHGVGVLVPASVVVHSTRANQTWYQAPASRFYFHVRNTIWMLTRSSAFSRRERLVRALKFTPAVVAYVVRFNPTLDALRSLSRGLRDGILRAPTQEGAREKT